MGNRPEAASVRQALVAHAPTLRPHALDLLTRMYSEPCLEGTETVAPLAIDQAVRIPLDEGAALYRLLKEAEVSSSIEIGFAYGFSTIWLLEALSVQAGARHVAIDPFEKTTWQGIGLKQVEELACEVRFDWLEAPSALALPDLLRNGHRADFVFIDGYHRFDDTLVEFYLADQLLAVNGMIAFDDLWMPSVRSVIRFILANRAYEMAAQIGSNICALRKTGNDERPWDHFEPFRTRDFAAPDIRGRIKQALRAFWRAPNSPTGL